MVAKGPVEMLPRTPNLCKKTWGKTMKKNTIRRQDRNRWYKRVKNRGHMEDTWRTNKSIFIFIKSGANYPTCKAWKACHGKRTTSSQPQALKERIVYRANQCEVGVVSYCM